MGVLAHEFIGRSWLWMHSSAGWRVHFQDGLLTMVVGERPQFLTKWASPWLMAFTRTGAEKERDRGRENQQWLLGPSL